MHIGQVRNSATIGAGRPPSTIPQLIDEHSFGLVRHPSGSPSSLHRPARRRSEPTCGAPNKSSVASLNMDSSVTSEWGPHVNLTCPYSARYSGSAKIVPPSAAGTVTARYSPLVGCDRKGLRTAKGRRVSSLKSTIFTSHVRIPPTRLDDKPEPGAWNLDCY